MVVSTSWIPPAIDIIEDLRIEHRNYAMSRNRIGSTCRTMFKGELAVMIGPSRVGKTRCVKDALGITQENAPDDQGRMRCVLVDASNDSTNGEFSTKGFMVECLKSIFHPIYGIAAEDDPWGGHLDHLLDRTPERTLRSAFERALDLRKVEYLIIDEAHHVTYAPGGNPAAAKILDSWKCMANRTRVKLLFTGSYELLSLLTLAPHLIGRQQPLEFPRYRSDSLQDVEAWEQLLRRFSQSLEFSDGQSLSTWNRFLFDGSLGRAGGLSLWLRTCLAMMLAEGLPTITRATLEASRLPAEQESAILEEILDGEKKLYRHPEGEAATGPDHCGSIPADSGVDKTRKKNAGRKPFQRKPRRSRFNCRA